MLQVSNSMSGLGVGIRVCFQVPSLKALGACLRSVPDSFISTSLRAIKIMSPTLNRQATNTS